MDKEQKSYTIRQAQPTDALLIYELIVELAIYETLNSYIYLFENKKILKDTESIGDLSLIKNAFQNLVVSNKSVYLCRSLPII